MILRNFLDSYLNDLLECNIFNDSVYNGLQIEGSEEINSLCTAVSISSEVIDKVTLLKSDAVIVHHGYFWKKDSPAIIGIKKKQIEKLIKNNISLFAYHLPLDCHKEIGNNICLGKLFELDKINSYKVLNIQNLLWYGSFKEHKTYKEFIDLIILKIGRIPLHIPSSNKYIKNIAWCTGAAQDLILKAYDLGIDAYISGEISERTYYQAQDLNIHYFSCGHHATERFGIQALGNYLKDQFSIEHYFIETFNPV
ncbi:Nif3-like dinuclear metal center hexameric protein [Candidatus Legionella polyplacis]|uniref:Nif3-like dinuclear metal center hexameric protein n=1 Tax=Candidatus Legionella polyplacis TaxID=2005262 RepID=A0ABZ2GXC8_9GAMM